MVTEAYSSKFEQSQTGANLIKENNTKHLHNIFDNKNYLSHLKFLKLKIMRIIIILNFVFKIIEFFFFLNKA